MAGNGPGWQAGWRGRRAEQGLLVLLPAALALWLYWPSLRLPLIYDTLLHIRISRGLNLATVWLPTEAFGFYRPLTFLPLLLIERLFGSYPAWLLHGLNVGQHALNSALLAALSRRLWGRASWALLAGTLLALFPFSYQAVAVYGHNVHPATAGLILLGLHAFLGWQEAGKGAKRWAWGAATLLLFALALLSHESAILFGPFAALIAWSRQPRTPWRLRSLLVLPASVYGLTLAGLVYAGIYQFLPITRAPQASAEAGGLWAKALYLLQALAYPFTWFAHLLPALSANGLVLGSLALTLALALWAWRTPACRRPLLLGSAWYALSAVLLALPLPAGYLLHGPRLLYLGSLGLALLWPALLQPLWRLPGWPLPWLAALAFIAGSNGSFVRGRLAAYANLTRPLAVARAALAGEPPGEGLLLVNLPQWLAPSRNTYAVGAEFVAMLADYLFVEELIDDNGLAGHPAWAVAVPDLLSDPGYGYRVQGQTTLAQVASAWPNAGTRVLISRYGPQGVETSDAGLILPPAAAGSPLLANFGPYDLTAASATLCQGEVAVALAWRVAAGTAGPTTTIFVQGVDGRGQVVAQADGPPLGLRPDLPGLKPGWRVEEVRQMPAGENVIQVLAGVYDFGNGQRFAAQDGQGKALPDNALSLPVSPCP